MYDEKWENYFKKYVSISIGLFFALLVKLFLAIHSYLNILKSQFFGKFYCIKIVIITTIWEL